MQSNSNTTYIFHSQTPPLFHPAHSNSPSTTPSSCVTVEIFMEEQQVLPIWVLCIAVSSTMAWPIALCIRLKQGHHPSAQLLAHLSEVHLFPTLGGTVHLEVISIEEMKPLQRLDDEIVDCRGDKYIMQGG